MSKIFAIVLLSAQCSPLVGSINEDLFSCSSDQDCGGDGYTCVDGICRDPLWSPPLDANAAVLDASITDLSPRDQIAEPDTSSVDQGLQDHTVPDTTLGLDAGQDINTDAAGGDLRLVDSFFPEPDSGENGRESGPVDLSVFDALPSDQVFADLLLDQDGAPVDAVAADVTSDAALDSGPVGPSTCHIDEDCVPDILDAGDAGSATDADPSYLCFSGRCATVQWQTISNDATEGPRSPSLALTPGKQPAVVNQNVGIEFNSLQFRYFNAGVWSQNQSLDADKNTGLDPMLQRAPDGSFWVSYGFNQADYPYSKSHRLAHLVADQSGNFDVTVANFSDVFDGNLQNLPGFVVDADGALLLLQREDSSDLFLAKSAPNPDIVGLTFESGLVNDGAATWPRLIKTAEGQIYGTFIANQRPQFGALIPGFGFVSVPVATNDTQGCATFGLPSNQSCSALQPFNLQVNSLGQPFLCGSMRKQDNTYALVLVAGDRPTFEGVVLDNKAQFDTGTDPGMRCAIVVDAMDRVHVFAPRTENSRGLIHHVVERDPEGVLTATSEILYSGDTGQWPVAQVDSTGQLHMVFVDVTERNSNYSHGIKTSQLIYGLSQWEQ